MGYSPSLGQCYGTALALAVIDRMSVDHELASRGVDDGISIHA